MPGRVVTLGHGNRSWDAFLALLRAARVEHVVDVRRYPYSRRWPWFRKAALAQGLAAAGVGYTWLGETLGGYSDPPYPAYTRTEAFRQGLARLEALASEHAVAILCAEKDWRRCHRRFIAEALCRRGWQVEHWLDPQHHEPHPGCARLPGLLEEDEHPAA